MDVLTQIHLFIPTYEVRVESSLKEDDITLKSYRPEPSEHIQIVKELAHFSDSGGMIEYHLAFLLLYVAAAPGLVPRYSKCVQIPEALSHLKFVKNAEYRPNEWECVCE